MAHGSLQGVPGGAEVWDVDGTVYLVYFVPDTTVPLLFEIERLDQLGDLFEGQPHEINQRLTRQEANARGVIVGGASSELDADLGQNPFDGFLAKIERRAPVEPWLLEPDVVAELAASWLRGDTEPDIRKTDWYQSKSDAERQWISLQASDPTTAEAKRQDNRTKVQAALMAAGVPDPAAPMVSYLADMWTEGKLTDQQVQQQILRETDPTRPDASPFAGRFLPEGTGFVRTTDGRLYAEVDGEYWRLTGRGQEAKYVADPASVRQVTTVNEAGDLLDYFADMPLYAGAENSGLGGAEKIREAVLVWLGPHYGKVYLNDQAFIEHWAGRIRRNPNDVDRLADVLRDAKKAVLPNVAEDVTYRDHANIKKAIAADYKGGPVDDEEDWFLSFMKMPDDGQAVQFLRATGMEREWAPVVREATSGALKESGGSVRRPVGV